MAKGEGRYTKPDPKKMQDKAEAGAEKKAEADAGTTKNNPEMMKTAGKTEPSPVANGVLSEAFKRHLDERRQMNTRHEREHREMGERHMRELGGTLTQAQITDTSGVGGPGGEAGA